MKDTKLISHRGNLWGGNIEYENHPKYLDFAIAQGFEVECDIRSNDVYLYLGHDEPKYNVSIKWLLDRKDKLVIHCKDLGALSIVAKHPLHYFWHESDSVTLTSKGIIWVHPNTAITLDTWQRIDGKHILVNNDCRLDQTNDQTLGVCTDFVYRLKERLSL